MEDEPIGVRRGEDLPELLQGPGRRRVTGDVDVHEPAASHLHHDEDVEHSARRGHHHAEVAGDDRLGVLPLPGRVAPAACSTTSGSAWPVTKTMGTGRRLRISSAARMPSRSGIP